MSPKFLDLVTGRMKVPFIEKIKGETDFGRTLVLKC